MPQRSINILPLGEAPVPEPDVAAPVQAEPAAEPRDETVTRGFWRRVSELLAAVWLLTVIAWWWSSRPQKTQRQAAPVPLHKQQAKHLKAARKAALAAEGAGVRKSLLEWAALQWPDDTPRSIGALAQRVSAPLADELCALSSLSYGRDGGDWNGEALAKAIRSFSVLKDEESRTEQKLPPLMPAG